MKKNGMIAFILSIFMIFTLCLHGLAAATDAPDAVKSGISADVFFDGQTDYVSEQFQSHLPLIIMESDDEIEAGAEQAAAAYIRAVDSGGYNRPDDEGSYGAEVLIHALRYENDDPRPKKDYFFSVDGGASAGESVLGLDAGNRWFLLGGAYDKSLIRNYLGYTLSARVLDGAPGVRFCELLRKDGYGYKYEGVYLLVEGDHAEGSIAARRTEHYWEGFNQTVVSDDYMGLFVLQDDWGGGSDTALMNASIKTVGDMFKSRDTNYYLQYTDVLDVESFYAYFLINELMASYEGMNESVYTYDPVTRKISVGPIWNFERALDNQKDEAMDLRRLKYQRAPFYQHMIIDGEFVTGLINTSKENAVALSGSELGRLIDSAVGEIGEAQERDWRRWQSFYLNERNALSSNNPSKGDERVGTNGLGLNEDGALLVEVAEYYQLPQDAPERIRQFQSYEQEIIKLKFYANERPAFVRRAILLLKNQDDLLTKVNSYGQNTVWALLFLVGFVLSILFARKTAER